MKSLLSEEKKHLSELMMRAGCGISPVRRTDDPMFLLASPLPLRESPERYAAFCTLAEKEGWKMEERNGWVLLNKDYTMPAVREIHPTGECASLCSLLIRHPSNQKSPALVNEILKAADENEQALEKTCESLHRLLADSLRKNEPIPDLYGVLNDSIWRYETC